jgi:ectoine hydroxylase-related dioxygenase (phytanoyl-CoA dioxygenase family)
MFHENEEYRMKMNDAIVAELNKALYSFLGNQYEILYGNFMVKEPGEESVMKIHQDWTYVDETKNNSFAIWVPLCNLTTQNGAFHVVPYSHNSKNLQRGPGTHCPFFEHREIIEEKFSNPLYLKAGEAVCWNHRLAHYSPSNLSEKPRIAVTVIIVPKNKEIIHFYKSDNIDLLECFSINKSFFFKYKIGFRPTFDCRLIFKENYNKINDYNELKALNLFC